MAGIALLDRCESGVGGEKVIDLEFLQSGSGLDHSTLSGSTPPQTPSRPTTPQHFTQPTTLLHSPTLPHLHLSPSPPTQVIAHRQLPLHLWQFVKSRHRKSKGTGQPSACSLDFPSEISHANWQLTLCSRWGCPSRPSTQAHRLQASSNFARSAVS